MVGLKAKASLAQALVASWAAGNGNLENRNQIQTLRLVKSICVLIHIKSRNHCLNLYSGVTVVTHLDRKSAMGLFLPGTWITMISILKMAVISQTFLAQVAKKGSLILPVFNISTTAWLSQKKYFFGSPKLRQNFEGNNDIEHFQLCDVEMVKLVT